MKAIISLTILAFVIACVSACNPDGSNEPKCTAANIHKPIRNFWDATHFWWCSKAGTTAFSVRCPNDTGFDSARGRCVPWKQWRWRTPCPRTK